MDEVLIRPLARGETAAACALMQRVFDATIAPDAPPEGRVEFYRTTDPAALDERLASGRARVLVAIVGGTLAGVLELSDDAHIAQLFVAPRRRGLGRALVEHALALCRAARPDLVQVGVNATPGAVPFYRALAFEPDGDLRVENGLPFQPMRWRTALHP